MKFDQQTNY